MNKALRQYVDLESITLEFDKDGQIDLADALRDILDTIWYKHLTPDDYEFLNQRVRSLKVLL